MLASADDDAYVTLVARFAVPFGVSTSGREYGVLVESPAVTTGPAHACDCETTPLANTGASGSDLETAAWSRVHRAREEARQE
jgi:hypothetical protein